MSTSFDPGKSNGEGEIENNRIGNPRSFDLDLSSGKFIEHKLTTDTTVKILSLLQQFPKLIISFFQSFFLK